MGKLIGYRRFSSKKGQPFCVALIQEECSQRENERGVFGSRVDEVFLPEDMVDFLEPKHIGHDVKLGYTISNGRAYLDTLEILK